MNRKIAILVFQKQFIFCSKDFQNNYVFRLNYQIKIYKIYFKVIYIYYINFALKGML